MTFNLRINLAGLFFLLFTLPVIAANIAIIESQSFNQFQVMDDAWQEISEDMGHQATILPQSTLDDLDNLAAYDVLIISSGLITTPENHKVTIEAFAQSGRNVYIQSEFDINHSGNVTFAQIVNNNGGSFQWLGGISGSIAPVTILPPLNEGVNTANQLFYYWHGTYGAGDTTITPVIRGMDKDWAFIFNSPNPEIGSVITVSDQDWIRVRHSDDLLGNILTQLTFESVVVTPTVVIDQTSTPNCEGETYEFTATITDSIPAITLQWQINGQEIIGANQATFTVTDLLDSDVVECLLGLNDNNQGYSHLSNPILIAPVLPLAQVSVNITASELLICANEIVTFAATGENWGDQPQFFWSIDGVEISDQNNATFSTIATDQTVSCTVVSNETCVETAAVVSNMIIIDTIPTTQPTIDITASDNVTCAGTKVDFSAKGDQWNTTTNIEWFVNGLSVANQPAFSSSLLENGQIVTALLTQTNECGDLISVPANTISFTIVDSVTPAINISANVSEACPGEPITYTATGNNWGDTPKLNWMVNGSTVTSSSSAQFVYGQSTTLQVVSCELVTDEFCATTNSVLSNHVTVAALPAEAASFAIESDNASLCNGNPVNFRAVGESWGASPAFEWRINGMVVSTASAFYSTANLQTGDQVTCQLVTQKPCVGTEILTSNTITVQTSNFALELMETADAGCGKNNGLIEFAITGGLAPYTIQWNNGLSETFSANLAPGNYEIFAMDAGGCTAELAVTIGGITGPRVETLQVENATCAGSYGTASIVMADTVTAFTYQWVNEQNFLLSDSSNLVDARAGDYTVLVTNPQGCIITRNINIVETVKIEAEILTDTVIALGEEATLSLDIFANSPVSIAWNDSTILSCNDCFETTTLPTESKMYSAVITSQEGCTLEVSQMVAVTKTRDLHIPNAFSPNGDGINDSFTIFGGSSYIRNIKSLQIFNRWGAKVFTKTNMDINDEGQGWNGKTGAADGDTGVYIYVAEIEFIDGETTVMTGDVSLIK